MKEKRTKTWLRKLVLMALCLTLTVISVPCPAQAADSDSKLEVTFLDVGQADAALIQCDGHSMLIDGGNAADSSKLYSLLSCRLPEDWLRCPGQEIAYFPAPFH